MYFNRGMRSYYQEFVQLGTTIDFSAKRAVISEKEGARRVKDCVYRRTAAELEG